jgi:uncharacterized cupin superfamily protein
VVTHVDASEGWEHDEETGGLVRMLQVADSLMIGLWKPNGAAGRKIEYVLAAKETLVVLQANGELRVDDGEPIALRPGVVVSLSPGSRLSWLVDAEFREVWIYS